MRSRILAVPVVSDLGDFGRLIAHLGHYFGHLDPERVAILVDEGLASGAATWLDAPSVPPGFDDRIVDRIGAMRGSMRLRPWPGDIESVAVTSDVIVDWDAERSEAEPWASVKARYRPQRTLFSSDWRSEPYGATALADAARVLGAGRGFDRAAADRLLAVLDRLEPTEAAYLLGAGPSARNVLDRDLGDGLRIACDAVALDDELMDRARPHVLALADPILHTGPSAFAGRFRDALAHQARRLDFGVVTTERLAGLLRAHVPEIAGRVIGLRLGPPAWPTNLDLRAHPAVRTYPDVLTMLALPIAATVARSITLIGFDGRDPDDGTSWRHGHVVRPGTELEEIRQVHPGFLQRDAADEYREHCAAIERVFRKLEERGTEVRSLTASSIPAIARRGPAQSVMPRGGATGQQATLVSLTPDWLSEFGHFGPFERRVRRSAEESGHSYVALTSAALVPTDDWQVPTFSEASFISGDGSVPVGRHFEAELRSALERPELDAGAAVFFYTADVWHLVAVLTVAADHPQRRFVVNLMRAHGWIARALDRPDAWRDDLSGLLGACLAAGAGTNVVTTVDSEALRQDVRTLTGREVAVWPMIAVSRPTGSGAADGGDDAAIHVVCPVQAVDARGFPELVELAERLTPRLARNELRLTARWPAPTAAPLVHRLAERLESHGARLVPDDLSDEAFADLIASADIVLVPYRTSHFRTRTSAVAVDALLAGKPVVAARGTWAGDLIDEHAAGLTYADGSVVAMEEAIIGVAAHMADYRQRMRTVREMVATEFSPQRLIAFLRGEPGTTPTVPPDPAAVLEIGRMAEMMRRRHADRVTAEDALRVATAIHADDQQRLIDTLKDKADLLERGIEYWRRVARETGGDEPA